MSGRAGGNLGSRLVESFTDRATRQFRRVVDVKLGHHGGVRRVNGREGAYEGAEDAEHTMATRGAK